MFRKAASLLFICFFPLAGLVSQTTIFDDSYTDPVMVFWTETINWGVRTSTTPVFVKKNGYNAVLYAKSNPVVTIYKSEGPGGFAHGVTYHLNDSAGVDILYGDGADGSRNFTLGSGSTLKVNSYRINVFSYEKVRETVTCTVSVDLTPPIIGDLSFSSGAICSEETYFVKDLASATLAWPDSTDSGCGFGYFELWFCESNQDGTPKNNFKKASLSSPTSKSYSISNCITNEGKYFFKLKAYDLLGNSAESANLLPVVFDKTVPAQASGTFRPIMRADGSYSINLSITPAPDLFPDSSYSGNTVSGYRDILLNVLNGDQNIVVSAQLNKVLNLVLPTTGPGIPAGPPLIGYTVRTRDWAGNMSAPVDLLSLPGNGKTLLLTHKYTELRGLASTLNHETDAIRYTITAYTDVLSVSDLVAKRTTVSSIMVSLTIIDELRQTIGIANIDVSPWKSLPEGFSWSDSPLEGHNVATLTYTVLRPLSDTLWSTVAATLVTTNEPGASEPSHISSLPALPIAGTGEPVIPETILSGTLTESATLSGKYAISGAVIIPAGITITITEGATILAYPKEQVPASILVETGGTLIIYGSSVTNAPGYGLWNGITARGDLVIDGASLSGAERAVASLRGSNVIIKNCIFEKNRIGVNAYDSCPEITTSTFRKNAVYAIKEDAGGVPTVSSCSFANNLYDYYSETLTTISVDILNTLGSGSNHDNKNIAE